jgi:hypothetical protein
MNSDEIPISEQVGGFNTYSTEIRNRIESLTKQVLVVSGGIQTLTIGAFLSGKSPKLPVESISALQNSWMLLAISVICCLILMFGQVIAMMHVGSKQKDKLVNQKQGLEVLNAALPLRFFNWVVGIAAFLSCLVGVFLMAKAASIIIA